MQILYICGTKRRIAKKLSNMSISWWRQYLLKCRVRSAERKIVEQYVNTFCSNVNWSYAAEALVEKLSEVAGLLNSAQRIYKFRVRRTDDKAEAVYQVALEAHRASPIPPFSLGKKECQQLASKSRPSQVEQEKHASLIFTCTNMGCVIVSAFPHSSSNQQLSKKDPYILATYNDCEKLRRDVLSHRVSTQVTAFLELQRVSSFDCAPTLESGRILRRLSAKEEKCRDLFSNDSDRRLERHRINWTLGTAVIAALMAVSLQSLGSALENFGSEDIGDAIAVVLTATAAIIMAIALKSVANR